MDFDIPANSNRKLGAKRLLKLADHLEAAVKADKYRLSMGEFIGVENVNGRMRNACGTAGCALGFCPVAFPRSWEYSTKAIAGLQLRSKRLHGDNAFDEAEKFFGLSYDEGRRLFSASWYPGDTSSEIKLPTVVRRIRKQAAQMAPELAAAARKPDRTPKATKPPKK